ncbi:MAG TPA: HD domain-containing phosphohydrolase [Terriglobales bacterium]|nr:HD domain-containing phosphohydrolase [Terriglobales bacterium]
MADKILFVDDEPAVLDGYRRTLHRDFEVDTAVGGEQGLSAIESNGPYAVVVSDMRMPLMNGAQFLARVKQTVPDTVRMLLTGHADLTVAMDAVNEGNIFRFLTKPCEKDTLSKAMTAGIVQHRLVTAEKELLENTLMGSIKVLTDVLSAVSPEAFGRSMRITRCVRHLVNKFALPSPWRFEAAAMLSQLGCVTLDPELTQAAYLGNNLSPEDKAHYDEHPRVARDLLVTIPRLEPIAWMISQQFIKDANGDAPPVPASSSDAMRFGAKLLKLAVAYDDLRMQGMTEENAIARLRHRAGEFGGEVIDAMADMKSESGRTELRKVLTSKLAAGMILQQEIRNKAGMLVVAKGQEVTHALLLKLVNFSRAGTIAKEVMALVPV